MKAMLLGTTSDIAVHKAARGITQQQFNEACKRSGIELGALAVVQKPGTRHPHQQELRRVPPEYWTIVAQKELK